MLRDKGNTCMRRGKFHDLLGRPFLRQPKWWDEGLIDFKKKMYTLYILEMHIGKKRILHI